MSTEPEYVDRTEASDEEFRARFARFQLWPEDADVADESLQRVREVADELDYYASKTTGGTADYGYSEAAERIRAALGRPR